MNSKDLAPVLLVAIIWGANFTAIRLGLTARIVLGERLSPLQWGGCVLAMAGIPVSTPVGRSRPLT